jgi:hypothetical protein
MAVGGEHRIGQSMPIAKRQEHVQEGQNLTCINAGQAILDYEQTMSMIVTASSNCCPATPQPAGEIIHDVLLQQGPADRIR